MTDKGTRAIRITEDDQAVLAMDASRMSLDSIASTMGWSRRRLEARLAVLKAPPPTVDPVVQPVASIGEIVATAAAALPARQAPVAAARKPRAARPMRRPALLGDRKGIETLKPLTARRVRYCRWFHDAGWPVEEIAELFDTPEGDLAQALGVAH